VTSALGIEMGSDKCIGHLRLEVTSALGIWDGN
jgi:hypothetical protein